LGDSEKRLNGSEAAEFRVKTWQPNWVLERIRVAKWEISREMHALQHTMAVRAPVFSEIVGISVDMDRIVDLTIRQTCDWRG